MKTELVGGHGSSNHGREESILSQANGVERSVEFERF